MATKIRLGLTYIFALMFINGGLNKFLEYMPVPTDFPAEMLKDNAALMEVSWLMPLVGIVEILGAIAMCIPRFRALGILMLFPLLVGITLIHLTVHPAGIPMILVFLAIYGWNMYAERKKLLGLMNNE